MESRSLSSLITGARGKPPPQVAALLAGESPDTIRDVLSTLPAEEALRVAGFLPRAGGAPAAASVKVPGRIAEVMEPANAIVQQDHTVSAAIDTLVHHEARDQVSYFYVVDAGQRLVGVFGMRDLLLAKPSQRVDEIMVREPFAFQPDTPLREAIGPVVSRRYPRYPVVDKDGVLVGIVRAYRLHERIAAELSSQVGSMVGLDKDERIHTPLLTAFRMRHPWLQVNLLTAFLAAFVVAQFEDTIARIVVLAAFLPVLAGQSGNTGCQALAITLRSMTLGELTGYPVWRLLRKEILLGALNGALVGLVAAAAMWVYAGQGDTAQPAMLALVVLVSMVGACVGSGIFGVLVPLALRSFGADPAMASAIFLTTMTDVIGMGLMLLLATLLLM
jgi:magnesium transporter